jgi:hypothetical protein
MARTVQRRDPLDRQRSEADRLTTSHGIESNQPGRSREAEECSVSQSRFPSPFRTEILPSQARTNMSHETRNSQIRSAKRNLIFAESS